MPQRPTSLAFSLALLALLTASTASAGIMVSGNMTAEKQAKPGESYRGTIVLRNPDATPGEVKVYQTDYSFAADGQARYGAPGRLPRSNANWISLSRELVSVPAKGTERIDYEVKVPAGKDGGLSGTYWSLIMVEPIAKASAESAAPPAERSTQVTQVLRFAVQIVTQIGKPGAAGLTFAKPGLVKEGDKRWFTIDVANTGQRWLRPSLSLDLYSRTGSPIGKFKGDASRLYPGTSVRFKIDLGQTPNGNYLGMVAADGTGDNLFGANVELEIK